MPRDEHGKGEDLQLTQFSIDWVQEAIFWVGPDGMVLRVNKHASRLLEYTEKELLSQHAYDFAPYFDSKDWPEHWRNVKERGSFTFETIHRSKSGREFPVEIFVNYLKYQGEEYNCAIVRDDETTLLAFSEENINPGTYHLVITPLLQSTEGFPFNQEPGSTPQSFIATFPHGLSPGQSTFTDGLGEEIPRYGPPPDFLLINEILYDGFSSETDGEAFVELYGTPDSEVSGFEVTLINGANGEATDRITLPEGTWIPDDGILVLADLRTNSTSSTQVADFDFLDQFDPQNGPDAVHVVDREGRLLDALVYGSGAVPTSSEGVALGEGSPAPDVSPGHSLSRVEGVDTGDNAEDFMELTDPTPGVL